MEMMSLFAFFYGLCESERFQWGYPKGRRDDRSYFVQRFFNYNASIKLFLTGNQTIRCDSCGASFGIEKKETIEFYKWKCPECQLGTCAVVSLSGDFAIEVKMLDSETMLPEVELEILETLHEGDVPMKAGEIAALVDATYQLVGRRTAKLHEMGLVHKSEATDGKRSRITSKARDRYFGGSGQPATVEE